jgi:hypothetical protein
VARPQKSNVYHANAAALGALAPPTRDAGARLLDAASKMHQAIYGLDWQGQGRNAAETRADRELAQDRITEAGCDALADAHADGCKTMQPMIQSLQSQGQGLEADCFDVSEDWHVTDKFDYPAGKATMIHHGASEQAAADRMNQLATERGHEAATATTTLQRLADQLGDADHDTAAAILTAINQLDPHRRPARPHIQTVDQHTFKQDPSPPAPPGNPFAGWTDEQMAQVATEIAHGHASSKHFPEMTPADVARSIYDAMKDPQTRIATSIDSGGMALLRPDGTIVFINPKDGDYGTVFKPQPRPSDPWRTPLEYFEQHTKAFEPLPPPATGRFPPVTPGEMAAPAASPSPRPVEGVPAAEPRPEPPAGRGGAGSPSPRTGGIGPSLGGGGTLGGGGNIRPFPEPGMPPL